MDFLDVSAEFQSCTFTGYTLKVCIKLTIESANCLNGWKSWIAFTFEDNVKPWQLVVLESYYKRPFV